MGNNKDNCSVRLEFIVTALGQTYRVDIKRTWRKETYPDLQDFVDKTVMTKLEDLCATYSWPDDVEVLVSTPDITLDDVPYHDTDDEDAPNGVVL